MDPILNESSMQETSTEKIERLIQHMEGVIKGKREQINHVITCLLAKGHILPSLARLRVNKQAVQSSNESNLRPIYCPWIC